MSIIDSTEMCLGGCVHNVLVNLAKMQAGLPLYAGGCIGDDANGHFVHSRDKKVWNNTIWHCG